MSSAGNDARACCGGYDCVIRPSLSPFGAAPAPRLVAWPARENAILPQIDPRLRVFAGHGADAYPVVNAARRRGTRRARSRLLRELERRRAHFAGAEAIDVVVRRARGAFGDLLRQQVQHADGD